MNISLKNTVLPFETNNLYGSCVCSCLYILTDQPNLMNQVNCSSCEPSKNVYNDKSIFISFHDGYDEKYIYRINRSICIKIFDINHFNNYIDISTVRVKETNVSYWLNLYMEDNKIDILEFPKDYFIENKNKLIFEGELEINNIIHKHINKKLSVYIYKNFSPCHLFRAPISLLYRE